MLFFLTNSICLPPQDVYSFHPRWQWLEARVCGYKKRLAAGMSCFFRSTMVELFLRWSPCQANPCLRYQLASRFAPSHYMRLYSGNKAWQNYKTPIINVTPNRELFSTLLSWVTSLLVHCVRSCFVFDRSNVEAGNFNELNAMHVTPHDCRRISLLLCRYYSYI